MIPRENERAKTILLRTLMQQYEEGQAKTGQAIKPGMLCEIDATADDIPRVPPLYKKHATAGGPARRMICREDFLQGKGIGDAITDLDTFPLHECLPGDVVQVRVATNFVSTPGTKLKSAGDGTLVAHGGTGTALFEVEDTIDYTVTLISALITAHGATDPRAQPLVRVKAL